MQLRNSEKTIPVFIENSLLFPTILTLLYPNMLPPNSPKGANSCWLTNPCASLSVQMCVICSTHYLVGDMVGAASGHDLELGATDLVAVKAIKDFKMKLDAHLKEIILQENEYMEGQWV